MITVSLIGGLGNQMFQYAAGKALAERHGVALALDLSWFRNYELRPFLLDRLSVPEPDHFVPLLYVEGVRAPGEPVRTFNREVRGSLSMTSFEIGAA